MSVTSYFHRLDDDGVRHFRDDRETFDVKEYPDGETLQIYAEECLLLTDLVGRVKAPAPLRKLMADVIAGHAGASVYDDDDSPYLIDPETVARASRAMNEVHPDELRRAWDLDRLKAKYLEVEEWLWRDWGPNVLEDRMIPWFVRIRDFLSRAAERNQHVI